MAKARILRRDLTRTLAAIAALSVLSGCDTPRHGSMPIIDGAQSPAMGKLHTCADGSSEGQIAKRASNLSGGATWCAANERVQLCKLAVGRTVLRS